MLLQSILGHHKNYFEEESYLTLGKCALAMQQKLGKICKALYECESIFIYIKPHQDLNSIINYSKYLQSAQSSERKIG